MMTRAKVDSQQCFRVDQQRERENEAAIIHWGFSPSRAHTSINLAHRNQSGRSAGETVASERARDPLITLVQGAKLLKREVRRTRSHPSISRPAAIAQISKSRFSCRALMPLTHIFSLMLFSLFIYVYSRAAAFFSLMTHFTYLMARGSSCKAFSLHGRRANLLFQQMI